MTQLKIFFALFLLGTISALACKCSVPENIEVAFESSEIIIHGQVLNTELVKFASLFTERELSNIKKTYSNQNGETQFLDLDLIKIEMKIEKIYKGELTEQIITTYTSRHRASCGLPIFEKGREYIVYLSTKNYMSFLFNKSEARAVLPNSYWTNQCSLTQAFDSSVDQKLCELSE